MQLPDNQRWKGVPLEFQTQWARSFSSAPAKIRMTLPCPVCGHISLFHWHDGHRALWEWCQTCLCCEHSSARVPQGWEPEVSISPAELTAEPTAITEALRDAGFFNH